MFCLQHLLNVRHGGPGTLFYKIFNLMADLRILEEYENKFTKVMFSEPVVSNKISTQYSLIQEFLA